MPALLWSPPKLIPHNLSRSFSSLSSSFLLILSLSPTSATYSRDHSLPFVITKHCNPETCHFRVKHPTADGHSFTYYVLCYPHSNIPPSRSTIINLVLFHCPSSSPILFLFFSGSLNSTVNDFFVYMPSTSLPFCPFYLLGKLPNLIRATSPPLPTQLLWWKKNI